jgi:hypothetical protein
MGKVYRAGRCRLYCAHMPIPVWSLVTLFTELIVTASVYTIIWKSYRSGVFPVRFAIAVLGYETLFNISYMLSRELSSAGATVYSPYETGLAIFHGVFSLVMFVTLVTFFLVAMRAYKRDENYFLSHPRLTFTFAVAWGVSILSGIALFASLYLF